MSILSIRGGEIENAAGALRSAGGAFALAGRVSVDADFGSEAVAAVAAEFASALARACGTNEESTTLNAGRAVQMAGSFAGLDSHLAAAISS